MEDRGRPSFSEESSSDSTEKKDTKKAPRKRLSSLVDWIASRQEKQEPKEESDNKRGIFKRFLDKFVHVEPLDKYPGELGLDNAEDMERESPFRTLFTREAPQEGPEHNQEYIPEEDEREAPKEPTSFDWVAKGEQDAESSTPEVTSSEDINDDAEEYPTFPMPPQEEIARIHDAAETHATEVSMIEESATPQVRTVERSGEPLAAATLVGLGAEYLGRKRAVDHERTERERADQAQAKKLEQLRADQREAIEKLKQQRQQPEVVQPAMPERQPDTRQTITAEKPAPTYQQSTERQPARVEAKPTPEHVPGKKVQPERLAEQYAKRIDAYERQHEAPDKVLKEAMSAAEVDAPVEQVYERRQEVRDEPSVGAGTSGAISVGSILQKSGAQYVQSYHASSGTPDAHQKLSVARQQELYKQAARNGFVAAIFIVVLAVLAFLLV